MQRVTLRDVAARAGVSATTVSLALRDRPELPAATRARLRALADAMGYRPDPVLSALVRYRHALQPSRRGDTIALTSDFACGRDWTAYHTGRFYSEGIRERARELGYGVEEVGLGRPRLSGARLSKILYSRGIDGLIVTPLVRPRGHLTLDWSRFSALAIGYSCARPDIHRVTNNHVRSMALILRRLHGLGYRRIGYALPGWVSERIDHGWSAAFAFEAARAPRIAPMPWFLPATPAGWKFGAFRRWFRAHRPEVVIGGGDEVLAWLEKLGARVPADAGFVHLDLPDVSGARAGVFQNSAQVGRAAVDVLVGMLQRNERGVPEVPQVTLIDSTWVPGSTVRSLVGAARK